MGSLNCLKKRNLEDETSGWNNGSICHFFSHWMHLKTCTEVRVLRRGSKSRCSHCMCTLKLSRSGPYMRLVKIVNCYFIKMCYLIIYCYLKLIWLFCLMFVNIKSSLDPQQQDRQVSNLLPEWLPIEMAFMLTCRYHGKLPLWSHVQHGIRSAGNVNTEKLLTNIQNYE